MPDIKDLDDMEMEARVMFERWEAEVIEQIFGPELIRAAKLDLAMTPPEVMEFMPPEGMAAVDELFGGNGYGT